MKSYEEKIDRLIQSLKDAKDILAECNIEMQKCLGETKDIKYAIFEPETETFYRRDTDDLVTKLKYATLYPTIAHAKQIAETLHFRDYEIKIIQLKVVE